MNHSTKKHSKQESPSQLSLFQDANIQHWEQIRKVEINSEMFYSVLDIFKFYGEGQNPSRDWKNTLANMKRAGYSQTTDLVDYVFEGADGKNKKPTPIANIKGMFRIAQSARFQHWEQIRDYMAQAAKEKVESQTQKKIRQTIEYYESFNLGDKPEIILLKSKYEASQALIEVKSCISNMLTLSSYEWADFHSAEIQTLLGFTLKQIREARKAKSVRDSLNVLEYNALTHAERDLIFLLGMQANVDNQRLMDTVRLVYKPIGENLQRMLETIGIDALSGKPTLPSGKK